MNIKDVLIAARMAVTRGWKKFGKFMLCRTAPKVVVAGYGDQLNTVLRRAGLPEHNRLNEIQSDDSVQACSTAEPTFPEVFNAPTPNDAFRAAMGVLDYMVRLIFS